MELSKQLRTLALGAVVTFSVVGMPALHVFAAAPQGTQTGPALHGHLTSLTSPDLFPVQGGSTGQPGSLSNDECQADADEINSNLNDAQASLNDNPSSSLTSLNTAKTIQVLGENAGCFFVNPPF